MAKNDFDQIQETPECFSEHMGAWLCRPEYIQSAVALYAAGNLPTVTQSEFSAVKDRRYSADYPISPEGVAVITLSGVMQKPVSKFSGVTSTIKIRNDLRHATKNTDVKGILVCFDSVPGGTCSGTKELGDAILAARKSKPVRAVVTDGCYSAGYWVASQCEKITVNEMGRVGCIGVVACITDTSGKMEKDGIKVHVVSTGGIKGQGAPGTKITDEVLAEIQKSVDTFGEFFIDAVSSGRGIARETVRNLATGDVWFAKDAVEMGLADSIASFDSALAEFEADLKNSQSTINANKTRKTTMSKENTDTVQDNAAATAEAEGVTTETAAKVENAENTQHEKTKAEQTTAGNDSSLSGFQALADACGYEFAKANYGKPMDQIFALAMKEKDDEIAALKEQLAAKAKKTDGTTAVIFSKPEAGKKQVFANL